VTHLIQWGVPFVFMKNFTNGSQKNSLFELAGSFVTCVEQKLHPRPIVRQLSGERYRSNGRGFFVLL